MQFHSEKLEACACVVQSRLIAFVVLGTDPEALQLVCVAPVNHFSNP